MIIDGVLLVFQGVLNIFLLPISVLNIGIDFMSRIPFVTQFLQVVAYILPWSNLLPIFIAVIGIFVFRIGVALFKLILQVISAVH